MKKIIRKYSLRSGILFPIVIEKFISISIANLHIFVSKNGIETVDFKIERKR